MKSGIITAIGLALIVSLPGARADILSTEADFAYIMDADTGVTLWSKRGAEAMIPASMTKIMTAHLVFDRIREGRLSLDDEFVVSENAWRSGGATSGGSTMFLEVGSKVRVEDLLRGLIVQSGNDACIVLAEGISGSEQAFAAEMTARAKELGLLSANFKNATGLFAEGHVISAQDLAKLARMTITEFPEFFPMYSMEGFTWNNITQSNRNPLLSEVEGADGLKTGHLDISGYGLVGTAVRDGKRRIIVLNGMESKAERASEARRIMRAAFTDFREYVFADSGAVVATAPVWLGEAESVPLVVEDRVEGVAHVSIARNAKITVEYRSPVKAPVSKGQVLGELIVSGPDFDEVRVPVVAGEAVARKGFIARALAGLGIG